ncbi:MULTISPECIES: error-prone DNA polymerase [Asticcacaulis]|uniref:error-prone DNA polymerase n=1 Tax=Asticcacaulis TaxID=76890 RepID=UPI001AE238D1|nr:MULTISPECIES: error-prone DNA polymerase [Asticcacaulis]MBP2159558.1 error-prone DNA polymerase [Asticcacaulis solisilvae]MDR6800615.1 error-prone DNA polymerase [Asticcacaulis sp. BE141]
MTAYAELQVTTYFSFLRGASSPDDLFATAKALGISALGVADRNSLAGMVRAYVAAKEHGVRLIVGCRLDLNDGSSILAYPIDRAGYGHLCRLLSLGKSRAGKGECDIGWDDVGLYAEGLIAVLVPEQADDTTALQLRKLKEMFADRAYLSLTLRRRPNDQVRLLQLSNLASSFSVPTVVTNDVLFHDRSRRKLQDVLTCVRHGTTIDDVGFKRERHADRYLKPPEEMARLFPKYAHALQRTIEIMNRCTFSLKELDYQYPEEKVLTGMSAMDALKRYTWEGAKARYPEGVPDEVITNLTHELKLIEALNYAPYFLTVHAIVRYARSVGILCQGRGSAANSAVCYVLGVTSIDPARNNLLFERFISQERAEPPDIDIDFEHERREEVIQWIYKTYGREKAALTAVVSRYRTKGALRDVAKALGLPEDMVKTITGEVYGYWKEGLSLEEIAAAGINTKDRRIRLTLELAEQLKGAPRHLSQHPGGFVLTNDRLDELVPIEPARMKDRAVIEWDKDDIDVLKFMKVDVLALGMLTCMAKAMDLLQGHKDLSLELATIPAEDPRTYAMIRKADTLGTFQVESRAQMSMLPRLKPRSFYDLVVQIAIVRPGPIQGDMVHPYLRRREGKEPVTYPSPELERVLSKTLGIPLFQEQAMQVAMVAAGFTAGEADQLRRAMATFKHTGGVVKFRERLISGMLGNNYTLNDAERICDQLEGFGSYGFPESHSASFALIAYASCWIKCWHPDAFCCALLNSQPMGFYAAAQIVRDAREHNVEVRPVCINASRWDCTLEPTQHEGRFAVRLGFRMVKGLNNAHLASVVAARMNRPFVSIDDLWRRSKVPTATLLKLADADAFLPSLKLPRRDAKWAIKALRDKPLPLFASLADKLDEPVPEFEEDAVQLRAMTKGGNVVQDYNHIGLTLRDHPVSFLRRDLASRSILSCRQANEAKDGKYVQAAGMVLVRQRPGSASGVVFITVEDETGVLNVIVWPKVFEQFRRAVLGSTLMLITGYLQREGEVVHLIARSIVDLSHELSSIGDMDEPVDVRLSRADEFKYGPKGSDRRVQEAPLQKSRNFH